MKQIEQKKDILKSTEDPEQQQVLQSDIRSLELKKALLLEHK